MIKQPLVLSGVLWLGMAMVGARASSVPDGYQAVTQPAKGETITIAGCLVQGDPALLASQPPTDSGTASTGDGDYFVRTPVIQVPAGTTVTVGGSGAGTGGTSSTGAATSAGTPGKTTLYRVMGLDRDKLRPHLGHRVELQGSLRSDDAALGVTTRTTVDAGGRPTTRVEKRMDLAGAIDATAIRMVSASCQ
jgi:hypothetical protein